MGDCEHCSQRRRCTFTSHLRPAVQQQQHHAAAAAVHHNNDQCIILLRRRKAREQKAYSKQVQAEKQKERAQEKKRQIQQVQQLRKQREMPLRHFRQLLCLQLIQPTCLIINSHVLLLHYAAPPLSPHLPGFVAILAF